MTKKTTTSSSKSAETMADLMKEFDSSIIIPQKGTFIEGKISRVTPKEVRVDVGAKIDGIIMSKELELFKDMIATLQIGDTVRAYVVLGENLKGQLILSIRKYLLDLKWKRFDDALKSNETVTVRSLEINKGGAICNAEGLQGFLPTSQMDPSRLSNLNILINRLIQVRVIEVNKKENRLIFSERLASEEQNKEKAAELKSLIKTDNQYEAEIVGITDFGAFVKVKIIIQEEKEENGKKIKLPVKQLLIDGLIHISEISWEKVEDVNKYFKVGDKIKCLILGVDDRTGKLNCSLKRLSEDPWAAIAANFEVDEKVEGKISRTSEYGVFVMLPGNIEGLIHISKIPPGKEFKTGEKIRTTIESIDAKHRKISLIPIIEEKFIGYR